uniref:Uncharacterized protein n=1 Tax=Strigops habroptila TaxID=2489341 RepID=A0A672U0Y7_STRHB
PGRALGLLVAAKELPQTRKMLLVFFFVFLLVADYMKRRKPKHFPPSPFSLPFLGHLHLMNPSNPQLADGRGNVCVHKWAAYD